MTISPPYIHYPFGSQRALFKNETGNELCASHKEAGMLETMTSSVNVKAVVQRNSRHVILQCPAACVVHPSVPE